MDEQAAQLLRLRQHLKDVHDNPSIILDEKLLDQARYSLIPTLTSQDRQALILQVYQLLPNLQQDPAPTVSLLSKLLEPVSLSDVLALEPPVDFIAGLQVATTPFNNLTLSLLEKADGSTARILASAHSHLFIALVELWLGTQDEGVADKAGKVLLALLKADLPDPGTIGRDGSVWKRLFRDRDVYERIFAITDTRTGRDVSLNASRKTVAQARLLDWLPAVAALDWNAVSQSYHPDVEAAFGLKDTGHQSLLDYAMCHMVDYKRDVLMHRTLMAAYEALLAINPSSSLSGSPALDFLSKNGLHSRTLKYYIAPEDPAHDPLDVSFLYGPAAIYTARWAEMYPYDLESPRNAELKRAVLKKATAAVKVPAARWAHSHSPAEDLHVLASIPRSTLLALGSSNPVLAIPSRVANADALRCLATIFHGPRVDDGSNSNVVTFPAPAHLPTDAEELKAAQALYSQYLAHNPRLWTDATTHADTIALKDQALASIHLLTSVLSARWGGLAAVMDDSSPAKAAVVPWLLGPPKTFSNLVGGRGDAENAAYQIATARFDALRLFARLLGDAEGYADVKAAVEQRIKEGPWGQAPEAGGRIATMEL
ncbi:uncharacterized protein PV09_01203 [Verruconis gallopava]|uniref:DNA mismatch repair protein HSM3 N-terminal domain-containing protein n=1 Tax=Verruconis gallopava TaxID=253628 RepID=A0A0D2BAC5_9PEZI|nr:uncharacterized protein PV09_01203 [Verruconis gallopava]KIW08284.1 hypothetical protein PV09_01203 [Verruconis gallopava]